MWILSPWKDLNCFTVIKNGYVGENIAKVYMTKVEK